MQQTSLLLPFYYFFTPFFNFSIYSFPSLKRLMLIQLNERSATV